MFTLVLILTLRISSCCTACSAASRLSVTYLCRLSTLHNPPHLSFLFHRPPFLNIIYPHPPLGVRHDTLTAILQFSCNSPLSDSCSIPHDRNSPRVYCLNNVPSIQFGLQDSSLLGDNTPCQLFILYVICF